MRRFVFEKIVLKSQQLLDDYYNYIIDETQILLLEWLKIYQIFVTTKPGG